MPKPKPEIGASEVYLAIGKGCYGFSVDTALVSGLVTSADGLQLHGSCHGLFMYKHAWYGPYGDLFGLARDLQTR